MRQPTNCIHYIPGNFSDVETLANLAINSFSLKLQVANLVLHSNTSTSTIHVTPRVTWVLTLTYSVDQQNLNYPQSYSSTDLSTLSNL